MTVEQPWVEKYRPREIGDVASQGEVVKTLESALSSGNLPHLLFYGPPGTGKTTCALAIVRQLFGADLLRARVLELNASDERGIAVVRNKIKSFAAISVGASPAGRSVPPYKVIILDEADAMTTDAQAALRRTMETYSRVTRFIIICNYVSRIIEPLASRCAKFRFKPLHGTVIDDRINHICQVEGVELGPDALCTLSRVAVGDMRRAITTLQSAVRLGGSPVRPQTLMDVAGVVPDAAARGLLHTCREGDFAGVQAAVADLIHEGYPAQEVLAEVQGAVLVDPGIDDVRKARVLERLALADKALIDGADEFLQLLAVASLTQRVILGQA